MPDDDREIPDDAPDAEGTEEPFDAVKAAAELAAALGNVPGATEPEAEANPTNYTAILEDEVEALQGELAEKQQALQDAQERAEAARAEVDRARARLTRDAEATIERKRRGVIESFLDVVDDLDRAAGELAKNGVDGAVAQGVTLVVAKFQTVLVQHGVKHRPSLGEPFDPAHHEAIGTVPATDETPDGTIAAVVQEGYDVGEQTLRAARVVVAKG